MGNETADAVTKSSNDNIDKQEPVEEITIPPEKKDEILNEKYHKNGKNKISKLLNYFNASKFMTKKQIKLNDLSSGQYSVKKV